MKNKPGLRGWEEAGSKVSDRKQFCGLRTTVLHPNPLEPKRSSREIGLKTHLEFQFFEKSIDI